MLVYAYHWLSSKLEKNYSFKHVKVSMLAVDQSGHKYKLTYFFIDYFLLWCDFDATTLLKKYFPCSFQQCILLKEDCLNAYYGADRVFQHKKSNKKKAYLVQGHKSIAKFFKYNVSMECDVTLIDDVECKVRVLLSLNNDGHTNILKIKEGFDLCDGVYINQKKNLLQHVKISNDQFDFHKLEYWSFDLEVAPTIEARDFENRFPNGCDPGDRIVMISVSKKLKNETLVYYWGLPKQDFCKDFKLVHCSSELEMLCQFLQTLQTEQPFFIIGYNIYSYDIPCLVARLYFLLGQDATKRVVSSISSGTFHIPIIFNVFFLDYYLYVCNFSGRDLTSKKLNDVAESKLKKQKVEIDILSIHKIYQGSYELNDLETGMNVMNWKFPLASPIKCLYYCGVDALLCLQCHDVDKVFESLFQWSNFIDANMMDLLCWGKSAILGHMFKVYAFRNCNIFYSTQTFSSHSSQFLHDEPDTHIKQATSFNKKGFFKGGYNECRPGFYEKICGLDYDSEYPNVIITYNLSPETVIILREPASFSSTSCVIVPYESHEIETRQKYEDNVVPSFDRNYHPCSFVIDKIHRGVIPILLEQIITERFKQKKLFEETKQNIHDTMQYFLKILANSLYGVMGSLTGNLSNLQAAMACALLSRYTLLYSEKIIKHNNLDASVIYLDTDGLYMVCSEDVGRLAAQIINQRYRELRKNRISIKFEGYYSEGIFLSRKNYSLLIKDEYKATGFEKSAPKFIKEIYKFIFDRIKNRQCLTIEDVITNLLLKLENGSALNRSIKVKHLLEYAEGVKSCSVKLINRLNKEGNCVSPGSKVDFTYYILDIGEKESQEINPCPVTIGGTNHDIDIMRVSNIYHNSMKMIVSLYNKTSIGSIDKDWKLCVKEYKQLRFFFYLRMISITLGTPLKLIFFGSINYTFKDVINFHQ